VLIDTLAGSNFATPIAPVLNTQTPPSRDRCWTRRIFDGIMHRIDWMIVSRCP